MGFIMSGTPCREVDIIIYKLKNEYYQRCFQSYRCFGCVKEMSQRLNCYPKR